MTETFLPSNSTSLASRVGCAPPGVDVCSSLCLLTIVGSNDLPKEKEVVVDGVVDDGVCNVGCIGCEDRAAEAPKENETGADDVVVVVVTVDTACPKPPKLEAGGLAMGLNPDPAAPVLAEVGALVDGAPNVNSWVGCDCCCEVFWVG